MRIPPALRSSLEHKIPEFPYLTPRINWGGAGLYQSLFTSSETNTAFFTYLEPQSSDNIYLTHHQLVMGTVLRVGN